MYRYLLSSCVCGTAGGLIVKYCLRKCAMPGSFGDRELKTGSFVQDKARNALEGAEDSLKRNVNKATGSAQDAGKDLRRQAESAGDAVQDTARDLQRDVQKGADRFSN